MQESIPIVPERLERIVVRFAPSLTCVWALAPRVELGRIGCTLQQLISDISRCCQPNDGLYERVQSISTELRAAQVPHTA